MAQDPEFALGFAGLANAYYERDIWGGGGGLGAHAEEVRAAAGRALDLDSGLTEAHQVLASIRYSYDWDFSGAENAYLRAIELKPNLAGAHQGYGFLLTALGRHDEAVASAFRGATLDPVSTSGYGRQLYRARRYDEAITQYERALELFPDRRSTLVFLADAYTWSGRYQEAIAFIEEWERETGREHWVNRGILDAVMGRTDEALAAAARMEREGVSRWALEAIYMQVGRSDCQL